MAALKNSKHDAVAQAFLADPEKIGWRAYHSVYPNASQRAAETAFSRLLKKAEFAARIAELTAAAAEKSVVSAARVLDELAKLGFANMQDYMRAGADGDPVLDFSKLTRDQAAALQEVTVETFMDGAGDEAREVRKVKFRLADKRAALVDIGRQLGMFKERVEHTGKDGGPIKTEEVSQLTDLEVARRLAFLLRKGAQAPPPAPQKKGKANG